MVRILRSSVLVAFLLCSYWSLAQTHIVINEVYGGGGNSGATYKNDFVELYNPTASSVDISGWSVQYTSATGTAAWQTTIFPTGSIIEAGGYFLVQEAAGTGGTVNLPSPDAIGTLLLSGTAGKVALANTSTALVGCALTTSVIDFVGFGATANCSEGSSPTPAPSNTLSVERKVVGVDTDVNSADFQTAAPNPRNGIVKFTSTYPNIQNNVSQGFQLVSNVNKSSSITYAVVLPSGAAAPTAVQVKNGQDASGASLAANLIATITNTTSATEFTSDVSGLTPLTAYDVYFVAENSTYLQATPIKVSTSTTSTSPPTIYPSVNTITFPGYTVGSKVSAAQSYTLTASDLSNDIAISSSANYVISKDDITYSSAISFVHTDFDASASQTIYVKFTPNGNLGALQGTLTHSSTGASDKLVTLSAVSIDPLNQNFNDPAFLTKSGWTQYSKAGAQVWATTDFGHTCLTGCTSATADKAAQINGFATTSQTNEDWLISPMVDLTGFVNYPALSFWTISAFAGDQLQLKYSSDYTGTGDPTAATWTPMDGKFPASNSSLWTKSSNIILPKSSLYIAYVYTSSTTTASRWTLDDWQVADVSGYIDVPAINYGFGEIASGTHSDSKNFTFSGRGYGDVTISASEGFELSLDNTTFSASELVVEADALSGKTVYVRFAPASKKITWSGTINFKGTGLDASYGILSGSSYPKSESFNITAYNLEFFGSNIADGSSEYGPVNDALQVANVTTVMQTIGSDIFSVEEVSDDASMDQLVANLSGYSKVMADRWSYSFNGPDPTFPAQKIGIVYKTSSVQVVSSRVMFSKFYDDIRAAEATSVTAALALLPNYPSSGGNTPSNFWSSGRLPFMVTADVTVNSIKKRIKVVVLHSKSGSAQADYDRRKYDVKVLYDSLTAHNANDNIIILGDFNDDVDGSINTGSPSTYKVFVDDAANFNALTYPLSVNGGYSFPSSSSFLDHIIISNELASDYIANSTVVEDPRTYITSYTTTTSDHLPVSARFALSKASQVITFAALPAKTYGDPSFSLAATSSSGLPITYTSSDETIASISGNTVTIKKGGAITITALQAGDNQYTSAVSVVQSLTINKTAQVITFGSVPTKTIGDPTFNLTATSTSALAPSFTTASTDKVTIAGSQVTIVKAGSVTIKASQTGNESYNAAIVVEQTFCINPAKPTVTLSNGNTETPMLTSNASAGNQWYLNGTAIAGATNTTYTAVAPGVYKVQVNADNCLSTFSSDASVIVTAVEPSLFEKVTISPNPVEGYLTISGLKETCHEAFITDMTGHSLSLPLEKQNEVYTADVRTLTTGLYVARIKQGNTIQQIKFIKK